MRTIAESYGKVLLELNISEDSIKSTAQIFRENSELLEIFENPRIETEEKNRVIEALFPEDVRTFLKAVIRNQDMDCILDALAQSEELRRKKEHRILATYYYVTEPTKEQLERMKAYLAKTYETSQVQIQCKEDASILGGFILKVRDKVIDCSTVGRLTNMRQSIVRR